MKKLTKLIVLSIIGANAISGAWAFCMPPISGPNQAYLMCKQTEAIQDQTQQMQQLQQQMMTQQQQYQPIRHQLCFRDYFGNIVCH